MGARHWDRRRYRVLIWFDEALNVEQAAVGTFRGQERVNERTWTPEPFDTPHEVLTACMSALDRQLKLF